MKKKIVTDEQRAADDAEVLTQIVPSGNFPRDIMLGLDWRDEYKVIDFRRLDASLRRLKAAGKIEYHGRIGGWRPVGK